MRILMYLALASCAGKSESPTARCERARDHLVELHLDGDTDEVRADVVRRALGAEFIDTCARTMSEQRTSCITEARDANNLLACGSQP